MTKKAQHEITRQMFEQLPVDSAAIANQRPSTTFWKDAWRRLKKNRVAMASIVVLLLIVIMAIVAPMVSPYDYATQDIFAVNKGPSAEHWFGTDTLGRDIFTRCWIGARVSLTIALVATVINVLIGILYGGISGYFGGRVDMVMQRFLEVANGIPRLVIVTLLLLVLQPGMVTIIFALMLTEWVGMSRIARAEMLKLKDQEFVLASRTLGAGSFFIIFKEVLPNIIGPIITQVMFSIPTAIFTEAFLSFVGLGIPVPQCSLGSLISELYNSFTTHPYQIIPPIVVMSLLMLSFNLVADGLREALDPKMKSM